MKEDEGNSGLLRIILDARCFDTQLNKNYLSFICNFCLKIFIWLV